MHSVFCNDFCRTISEAAGARWSGSGRLGRIVFKNHSWAYLANSWLCECSKAMSGRHLPSHRLGKARRAYACHTANLDSEWTRCAWLGSGTMTITDSGGADEGWMARMTRRLTMLQVGGDGWRLIRGVLHSDTSNLRAWAQEQETDHEWPANAPVHPSTPCSSGSATWRHAVRRAKKKRLSAGSGAWQTLLLAHASSLSYQKTRFEVHCCWW